MANATNPKSWYARCRLAWLERKASQAGCLNRSDLMREFGISPAQASSDLQAYQQLSPEALRYDLPSKRYLWTGKVKLTIVPAPWADFPEIQ
jgi:hypothetical protein